MNKELHFKTKQQAINEVLKLCKKALRKGDDFRFFTHDDGFRVEFGEYWIDDTWHRVNEVEISYGKKKVPQLGIINSVILSMIGLTIASALESITKSSSRPSTRQRDEEKREADVSSARGSQMNAHLQRSAGGKKVLGRG